MRCADIGIKKCVACVYNRPDLGAKCWIIAYQREIEGQTDEQIKEKVKWFIKTDMSSLYSRTWLYYYTNVLMKLYPEKRHLIEKIMILL